MKHKENLLLSKETLSINYPDMIIKLFIIDIEGRKISEIN